MSGGSVALDLDQTFCAPHIGITIIGDNRATVHHLFCRRLRAGDQGDKLQRSGEEPSSEPKLNGQDQSGRFFPPELHKHMINARTTDNGESPRGSS
jgi:hypothetical protein